MKFNRIIVIVTDSVGAGDAPDAEKFGDKGADTYGHIDANVPLKVPNLRRLFERLGAERAIPDFPEAYRPGDVITCLIPGDLAHLMVVGTGKAGGRPLIVHNIGEHRP